MRENNRTQTVVVVVVAVVVVQKVLDILIKHAEGNQRKNVQKM